MLINSICNNRINYNTSKKFSIRNIDTNSGIPKSKPEMLMYGSFFSVYFKGNTTQVDMNSLSSLNIPNLNPVGEQGVRGESLSNKRNTHFLKNIKRCGIKQVIDLKTSDFNNKFGEYVKSCGMDYHHFPVDENTVDTKLLIKYLPSLFDQINKGDFYISCAQGLHRTDIALCLNYFFNPKQKDIPILRGHYKKGSIRQDDIMRRVNDVYRNLTKEDLEKLGWREYTPEMLKQKKADLIEFNRKFYNLE